jgi:hypothetical protein
VFEKRYHEIRLRRFPISVPSVAVACALGISCGTIRIPDLTLTEASMLISRAPEFNQYARLRKVERVDHLRGSLDSVSYGLFTFLQFDSPSDAPLIKGWADFRYWDGKWHLAEFDYGCDHSGLDPTMRATNCHSVGVYNAPPK